MRLHGRLLIALVTGAAVTGSAPVAQAAFGPASFEAGTCINTTCSYASIEHNKSEAFTQAAGHPPWGITKFELNHSGNDVEGAALKRIRVDVPPGLAADPQALPKCSQAQFKANTCPPETQVGTTELDAVAAETLTLNGLKGKVYNLETPPGLPLDFGIDVEAAGALTAPVQLYLEGHVDWSGDYHEYFEINNVPEEAEVKLAILPVKAKLKVLMSQLNFNGNAGQGNFLTIPSVCSSSTTSHLELESYSGEIASTETHTPVGVEGCGNVPFKPQATLAPEIATSDQPDGATVEVKAPQNVGAGEINTADIQNARVTLPEGLTLNPSAAHGLETCTAAQIGIATTKAVGCPAASKVGEVTIETDLPPNSLKGPVYLGSPSGATIAGPPFTIYIDAESPAYGVSVRLQGKISLNPGTGRLEATFTENPQLPFSDLIMKLNGGSRAPLANPLACGAAHIEALFKPFTGEPEALSSNLFVAAGCANPLPFSLGQSTQSENATAGAYSSYTFNLTRADGQQYLSQVSTTLPAGLLGAIPSVALCGEPQASTGSCAESAKIGTASVTAGSGPEPYGFSGPVYLTGPYNGAPYGLSIPVPIAAGPFNFGTITTRATIAVNPYTARVTATTTNLPTIVSGVPVRLKSIKVEVNRPSFIFNPTSCSPLASESTLAGFAQLPSSSGANQSLSSPFQVGACNALAFKPSFKAATSAKASKPIGASLQVNLLQGAHQANIHSVYAQLPIQLPSRLTTLQKACPEATFAANPVACRPLGSEVGTAVVHTPVLPGALTGSAYLVSHGGAAFPDLDLVLEDGLVRLILVGNTNIKKGITSSTFAAIPDAPVTSFVLTLPTGPHSALSPNGSLCAKPLIMPTVITAQNGAQIKQNTRISVSSCPVRIVSHRVRGHVLILTVRSFAAGRISVKGSDLHVVYKRLAKASTVTIKIPLSRGGLRTLHRRHRLKLRVRVGFVPKTRGESKSSAAVTVRFR
ncbi:MAG TPA: hypothetical protein VGL68_03950 [Solirubrobacteraceae bacterium]|jgi:hypothetical protein